ncbi:MAG: hypothetical protein WD851_11125 [Pirellulales bacterium]
MSIRFHCLISASLLSLAAASPAAEPSRRVHVAGWHSAAFVPTSTPAVVQTAPFAGAPNYVNRVPAFRWGWFGAETFPETCGWHRDAAGDWIYWSVQQRW